MPFLPFRDHLPWVSPFLFIIFCLSTYVYIPYNILLHFCFWTILLWNSLQVYFCDLLFLLNITFVKFNYIPFDHSHLLAFTNIWYCSVGFATIDLFSCQWIFEQTVLLWKLLYLSLDTHVQEFLSLCRTSSGILGSKVCVFLPLLDNGSWFLKWVS